MAGQQRIEAPCFTESFNLADLFGRMTIDVKCFESWCPSVRYSALLTEEIPFGRVQ